MTITKSLGGDKPQEEKVEQNNMSTIIAVVAAAVILVLVAVYLLKCVYNKANAEQLEKAAIQQKQKEIYDGKIRAVTRKGTVKANIEAIDKVIDDVRKVEGTNAKLCQSEIELEYEE